jgi:uncharacterized RDD family membrane protein YckC
MSGSARPEVLRYRLRRMIQGTDTRPGEATEPGFPSPAFSDPPLLAGPVVASPRAELVWSSPPPPRPAAAAPLDRFAAAVVDTAVVLAVLAASTLIASVALSRGLHWVYRDESAQNALVGTNAWALPLLVLVPTLAAVAYCSVLPGVAGATLGMRVLHLRLCRDAPGGGRVGARLGVARFALFAAGAACLLGPASLLRDPHGRAWHDRRSGTVIARARPG